MIKKLKRSLPLKTPLKALKEFLVAYRMNDFYKGEYGLIIKG